MENAENVERDLFLDGPEVAATIRRVENRLGFVEGELNFGEKYLF